MEEEFVNQYKPGPFPFGCDESNDTNQQKTLAIVVKYFDEVMERAITGFLDMPICNIGTAQSIFNQLDAKFEAKGFPWKNVVAFTSDNRPIQVKCVASVTNCGLGLKTAMAPTVNT